VYSKEQLIRRLKTIFNEEAHGLLSKKEKFRLARNFTVEFSLLSLIKLEAWKEGVVSKFWEMITMSPNVYRSTRFNSYPRI
jgi:hypothetical protein